VSISAIFLLSVHTVFWTLLPSTWQFN
jgi:hypothetical protein